MKYTHSAHEDSRSCHILTLIGRTHTMSGDMSEIEHTAIW